VAAGELQAGFTGNAGIGRTGSPTGGWQAGGPASENYPELIENVEQVEADWFRRTGIYPIHGLVVVRTEVLWKHPWVARALYDAFVAAKKPYIERLKGSAGDGADDKKYRGLMPLVGERSDWARTRPVTTEQMLAAMDKAGVAKAAIVQASTCYGHDNSYVADAVAAHPDRFTGVFSVDVLAPDAPERMRHWVGRK